MSILRALAAVVLLVVLGAAGAGAVETANPLALATMPTVAAAPAAAAAGMLAAAAVLDARTAPGLVGALPHIAVGPNGLTIATGDDKDPRGMSTAVSMLLIITVLAIAPGFLMMMTSFTRVVIVLGFLRRALGTQTLPPNQVMVGLALFLSLFIMAPTLKRVNDDAVQPFMAQAITQQVAVERAKDAVRDFMAKQTRKNDLALFIRLAGEARPHSLAEVSFTTLVPAFVTSELKTAFQMGFIIFLPFLVIDLVVSAVLMALGMMMLPPVVVSLPFKILLFVLVDGWTLLMQGLVASYS